MAVQLVVCTVNVYHDSPSRRGVEDVLTALLTQYGASAAKAIAAACTSAFNTMHLCAKATTPHVSVFRWTCIAIKSGHCVEAEFNSLVVVFISYFPKQAGLHSRANSDHSCAGASRKAAIHLEGF